ncbi:hypothetical protein DM02DRAFT_198360 [Periconia macrospinosa]|uniref:Uncharacterized protein n=1 Tax=Periconia macrospinosa TaxID=97972 RepID=A0A2V1D872_9PLEO|nr:hypothetical protein DM02DRAFT_198360 [Periconia macrospinosa]
MDDDSYPSRFPRPAPRMDRDRRERKGDQKPDRDYRDFQRPRERGHEYPPGRAQQPSPTTPHRLRPLEPRPRPRRQPSFSSESDSPPPRRRRSEHRRDPRPRGREDWYNDRDDRALPRRRDRDAGGYISDDRHNRPRRYSEYADQDRRPKYRDDRYDDMFPEPRSRRYDDRNDKYDGRRRDRYDDDRRYRDPPRRGRSVGAKYDWQKEGLNLFRQYALPVIKAEGGKYIAKQLAGFTSKQGR